MLREGLAQVNGAPGQAALAAARAAVDLRRAVRAALVSSYAQAAAAEVVHQRFNRARYDADQTVAASAATVKDTVDLESVPEDLASVVRRASEPAPEPETSGHAAR